MNLIQYFKSLGPLSFAPSIIRYGYVAEQVAYELASGYMDHEPVYCVSVARVVPTDDGGEMIQFWHEKSEPLDTQQEAEEYIVALDKELAQVEEPPDEEESWESLNDSEVPDNIHPG